MKSLNLKLAKIKRKFLSLILVSNLTLVIAISASQDTATLSADINEATSESSLPQPISQEEPPKIDPTDTFIEDELVVKFKESLPSSSKQEILKSENATVARELPKTRVTILKVDSTNREKILEAYEKNPNIEYVVPHYVYRLTGGGGGGGGCFPNDFYYCNNDQYGLRQILAPNGWNLNKGASATAIAILDSGVDYTHYDMCLSPCGRVVKGWDLVLPFEFPNDPMDEGGHGTKVASIVGANTNNAVGIAAVDWYAKIVAFRVADPLGLADPDLIAEGIRMAVDENYGAEMAVINISIAGQGDDPTLRDAVSYALGQGVNIVAAVAHDGTTNRNCFMGFPAAYNGVISVAATNESNGFATGCTQHTKDGRAYQKLQVTAPGAGIFTLEMGGTQGRQSGSSTSFAAPFVTGIMSILSTCSRTPYTDLIQYVDDLGAAGWDSTYGYGRVNLYNALRFGSCFN